MIYWFKDEAKFNEAKESALAKKIFFTERKVNGNFVINIPGEGREPVDPYPMGYLVSREYKKKSVVKVEDVRIGEAEPIFIAGYCTAESEEGVLNLALDLKERGTDIFRAGCYKPRTSPYDFQGFGKKALEWVIKAKDITGLPICVEILDARDIPYFEQVDLRQVGARNRYNHTLLRELGKLSKPILLKRSFSATLKELLLSAEVIMLEGNESVVLCERGIRTFSDELRNTLDIAGACYLKELSHLPVIFDPSHATGKASLVSKMSKAGIAAGLDGLMIEVHKNPSCAFSDRKQAITPLELGEITKKSKEIRALEDREI